MKFAWFSFIDETGRPSQWQERYSLASLAGFFVSAGGADLLNPDRSFSSLAEQNTCFQSTLSATTLLQCVIACTPNAQPTQIDPGDIEDLSSELSKIP